MRSFLLTMGFFLVWLVSPVSSFAQVQESVSMGIANHVPIQGEDIQNGHIVSFTSKGYFLSKIPYDPAVIGVVATRPAVSLDIENGDGENYPVVTSGNVEVNVSSANGNIKAGDVITSSQYPGIGMKATKTGYVLGTATEDYSSNDPKAIGEIVVNLNLHYSSSNAKIPSTLTDIFNLSLLATYESPSAVFKYVVAGGLVVISCILGFISFGRAANTGVEALGRNPLAGKMIQFGILFNVLITIAIVAAGVGVAIVIIRL